MPSCGALIVAPTGETEIFGFDFNTKMGGEERVNINFHLDPLEIALPFSLFPKFKFLKCNWGANDPIQKWYPKITTWRDKIIKKRIRLFGKYRYIPFLIPLPTQAYNELYIDDVELDDIPLFTIPSFNLDLDFTAGGSFTLETHFSLILSGISGLLLAFDTQQLIKNIDGANAPDMTKMSKTEVNTYIATLAVEAAFAPVLAYLVRDGKSLSYTINHLFGDAYIDMKELKLEFGDLKIVIPKFRLAIKVPDILADHPVEVEIGSDRALKVKILLFTIKGDFFQDMINGIEDTLSKAENATKYDFKALQDTLDFLKDSNNVVSQWAKNHLGLRSEYNFYFVLCPSGMSPGPESPHPPTPFFIQIEFLIYFNPYKILETIIDYTQQLNSATEKCSRTIANKIPGVPKPYKQTLQKQIDSSTKSVTKPIRKGLKDIKKRLDNKLINAERKVNGYSNIPIVP